MGESAAVTQDRAAVGPTAQAAGALGQPRSTVVVGGFAGSGGGESDDDEAASAPTGASTAEVSGFAKAESDSDDDGPGPYFPPLAPLAPLAPSQSQPASAQPAQGQVAPSADSSHDLKPDITSRLLDAQRTMGTAATTSCSAGAMSTHEVVASRFGGEGYGATVSAATASAAGGQHGGFAADSGSSDEEPLADVVAARLALQELASARAVGEDDKPPESVHRRAAPRVWAGDSDDDDDALVVDEPAAPAAALPSTATAAAAAAAQPAQPLGGFAHSSDEDDPVTLSPPPPAISTQQQQQQQRVASSRASSAQAAERRPSRPSLGVGAPPSRADQPELAGPSSSRRASTSRRPSPTLDEPSRPRPLKRVRPSVCDETHGASVVGTGASSRDTSPPSTSRAQQLKRLKIGRVGPPPPPPAAPSPAPSSAASSAKSPIVLAGNDRAPHASAVSSETSSLGSGAQARKVLDPFNHGVQRAKSSNGYVILNGNLLREKKLSTLLAPGGSVRWPSDVESEVDRIRHLWGIRTPSGPINGVYDFDGAMHLDGEPRKVYIASPPSENLAGRDKSARAHLNDYAALQLVLSSIQGVKQADSARESVTAVFVHATELGKVGLFPDGLLHLERYRMVENAIYLVYGTGEDHKRAMRPFWHPSASSTSSSSSSLPRSSLLTPTPPPAVTAWTFTPAAFRLNPARISALVERAPDVYSDLGYRSQFPWVPSQYLLRGGAFGPAEDVVGPEPRLPTDEQCVLPSSVLLESLS